MESMFVFSLLVLLFGVNLVTSDDCCVADQFYAEFAGTKTKIREPQGREMSSQNLVDPSRNRRIRFQGEAAIDHVGNRYAFNVSWHDYRQKLTGSMRVFKLVNESTSYVVKDNECHKLPYCSREPPSCVPDTAYLDETIFVGKNSLQLNTWKMGVEKQGKFHGDVRFATTKENCIPVFSSMIGGRKENSTGDFVRFEMDTFFFNYTEAFSPSSFVLPDICHNGTIKFNEGTVKLLDEWNVFQEGMIFF